MLGELYRESLARRAVQAGQHPVHQPTRNDLEATKRREGLGVHQVGPLLARGFVRHLDGKGRWGPRGDQGRRRCKPP